MSKFLLMIVMLLANIITQAQPYYNQTKAFLNENNFWVFAHRAGIDFSSGTAVSQQTAINGGSGEGNASVSDWEKGSLLFYSNGDSIWNANHQAMPNGFGLYGNGTSGISSRQGVCIVPVPGQSSQYYVFSLSGQGTIFKNQTHKGSLFYSVVDRTLDGGRGDIIPGKKNIALDTTSLSEAMIAIAGNNCDIWLLVHTSIDFGKPLYKAYHITENGIASQPVLSDGRRDAFQGWLSVSPTRNRIAFGSGINFLPTWNCGMELATFNPAEGKVSDIITIANGDAGAGGCSFSPDGKMLYFDDLSFAQGVHIMQYKIDTPDSATIASSRYVVGATLGGNGYKLYNDTIYMTQGLQPSISTIVQPNLAGSACNYKQATITLPIGTSAQAPTLCAEVVRPLSYSHSVLLDTALCGSYLLNPGVQSDDITYTWNNNSSNTSMFIEGEGIYWVKYNYSTGGCLHYRIDSFVIQKRSTEPFPVINVDQDLLSTTATYTTYQWMLDGVLIENATNPTHRATQNGLYRVIVSDSYGCIDTADNYEVTNQTGLHIINNPEKIHAYPNPASAQLYIESNEGSIHMLYRPDGRIIYRGSDKILPLQSVANGIYILEIRSQTGQFVNSQKIIKISEQQ